MEENIEPLYDIYAVNNWQEINLKEQYEILLPSSSLVSVKNANIWNINIGDNNNIEGTKIDNLLKQVGVNNLTNYLINKTFTIIYVKDYISVINATGLNVMYTINKTDGTKPTFVLV